MRVTNNHSKIMDCSGIIQDIYAAAALYHIIKYLFEGIYNCFQSCSQRTLIHFQASKKPKDLKRVNSFLGTQHNSHHRILTFCL